MGITRIKLSFSLLFLLLFFSKAYCQENTRFSLGIGYERLVPVDNLSNYFSSKSIKNTKDIQIGNGIVTEFNFYSRTLFYPYFKTGFIWHNSLKKDTLINSAFFSNEIKFNTIPIEAGLKILVSKSKILPILVSFGVNYNIMYRHNYLSYSNLNTNTVLYNFGYSFRILLSYKNITPLLGFAKKGDYNFLYGSIIIPIYPNLFK